jgi:hypothetical protein
MLLVLLQRVRYGLYAAVMYVMLVMVCNLVVRDSPGILYWRIKTP